MSSFFAYKRSNNITKTKKTNNNNNNNTANIIINEYKLKMNSFHPDPKSPNIFMEKLQHRIKKYYYLYKSKNDNIK